MARLHYLQHVPFEGLGSIGPWFETAGYEITSTRFFESPSLQTPEETDFLVVMGGPMSTNDEESCSWLNSEIKFIRRAVNRLMDKFLAFLTAHARCHLPHPEVFHKHQQGIIEELTA